VRCRLQWHSAPPVVAGPPGERRDWWVIPIDAARNGHALNGKSAPGSPVRYFPGLPQHQSARLSPSARRAAANIRRSSAATSTEDRELLTVSSMINGFDWNPNDGSATSGRAPTVEPPRTTDLRAQRRKRSGECKDDFGPHGNHRRQRSQSSAAYSTAARGRHQCSGMELRPKTMTAIREVEKAENAPRGRGHASVVDPALHLPRPPRPVPPRPVSLRVAEPPLLDRGPDHHGDEQAEQNG
jgi:hypothetical protein